MNDDALRPESLDLYVGQQKIKDRLSISIQSALSRGARLDHILLVAPPGSGKSSLAACIANELGFYCEIIQCPYEPRVLSNVCQGWDGVVLLDEIHLIPPKQQHVLLPVIEDGILSLSSGRKYEIGELLTIIAATTEPDKLIAPLIDRFSIKLDFDPYSDQEMAQIVLGMASKIEIEMSEDLATLLARASGGIPRNARSLVFMARDLIYSGSEDVTAKRILEACRVTSDGLSEDHLRYLQTLANMGGLAGLDPLSTHLRLPKATLMNLERLLVQRNLLEYTKTGRQMTHMGDRTIKENCG